MRWMIGMLLVGNLVVFLWWNAGQGRITAPASVPRPDVGTLQLISETPVESAGDRPPGIHEKAATPTPRQVASGRKSAPEKPENSGEPGRPPAKRPEPGGRSAAVIPTAAPEPPKAPVARSAIQAVETPVPNPPTVELACWELGPFEDEAQLGTLRLPKEVERLEVRHSRIRVPAGFYVLIPAQKDRKSARAVVRRLKQKGVRDFWLFNAGPLKNAISLGMFKREKNAQQRREEVAKLGFSAEVHARHRTLEGTVLHLKGPKSAAIERKLRSISAGQMRPVVCPGSESP